MKQEHWVLIACMVIVLIIRLFFVFQSPTLTGDQAYFVLRQVEHIQQNGTPILNDPLSYGGRTYFIQPLWYYVLAAPSFFFDSVLVLKILPNLCMVLLIPVCYRIIKKFVSRNWIAIAAATLAAWVPATFHSPLNDASPLAFSLLLFFFALDQFMHLPKKTIPYVIALVLLALTHSIVLVLVAVLLLYALLVKIESRPLNQHEREVLLFSVIFSLWIHVLLFKQELLQYGIEFIWGTIPKEALANYFSEITILQALGAVGYLPLLYGLYATLNTVFGKHQRKEQYLLLSLLIITTLVVWFKLLPLAFGLALLGICLSLSFGHFMEVFGAYLEELKSIWMRNLFIAIVLLLLISSSIVPSILAAKNEGEQSIPIDYLKAMEWLKTHTNPQQVVLAPVEEGNIITALAHRPTIADTQFRFAPDAETRYRDVKRIFTTQREEEAVALLKKYGVTIIVVSPQIRSLYGDGFVLLGAVCFDLAYNGGVKIYEFRC